jgi:hypothetical protein
MASRRIGSVPPITGLRAFALTVALWPLTALALDGNTLLKKCEDSSPETQNFCLGYIMGAADTLWTARLACPESGVKYPQVRDVVLKFLRDHPEKRHHSADSQVSLALAESFPCKDKQ